MDSISSLKLMNDKFMYNYQMQCLPPLIFIVILKMFRVIPRSEHQKTIYDWVAALYMGLVPLVYLVDCIVIIL